MLNLFFGSTVSIPFRKFSQSCETKLGIVYSPLNIFLYNAGVFVSSNGSYPQTQANKITPHDQMSTNNESYLNPDIISGAA